MLPPDNMYEVCPFVISILLLRVCFVRALCLLCARRVGLLFFVCVQERALRKSETRINAELSDLDKSIILKEALLAQIKEGQASFETMQQVLYRVFVAAALRQKCSLLL